MESIPPPTKIKFGIFEVDLQTEELRKSGMRIKIQSQPFKALSVMLERPGEVVSRDEMQQRLWGEQTKVDFDHSLGTAINKLREALGDSADNPRFIQTLARRGYRFIAPVSVASIAAAPESVPASPAATPVQQEEARHGHFWLPWAIAAFCVGLAVSLGAYIGLGNMELHKPLRISQITFSGRVFPGEPLQENLAATATDGTRIYFQKFENGQAVLAQVLIADGETSILPVPSEISAPSLGNISPDGSKLLVRNDLIPRAEQPLWIVPAMGGAARNFSNTLAHDATWMPDGKRILYAAGTDIFIANDNGTGSKKFAALPGRAFWLRWSPDGTLLRFTLLNPLNHATSLWEISSTGKNLHPLFSNWSNPASECCGSWTSDGKSFVFQSAHNGSNNIWVLQEKSFLSALLPVVPIQITNGPLNYLAPITANTGHRLFFIGLDTRSVLLKYDPAAQQFVPYGKTLNAASLVDFSRDGGSVAWINPEDISLWRSKVDGTQRLQLTAPPLEVFMMHWSPSGKRIVLMGREPGKLWRLYIVDAQGGDILPVLKETRNEADPDWSPDGNSLVFGRLPDLMAEKSLSKAIYIVDLKTRQVTTLPNSEGLFSPRWSPDGRYIVAMPLDQSELVLYDTVAHTWKALIARPAHDPVWSNDGRWIYFHDFLAEDQPVYRVSVPDGKLERVAGLKSVQPLDVLGFRFAGLTPGDVPLVSARISTANIYSINLNH
jgi:Tol biopolymer transport system component/DNA-binding winged helix-turn-helix (wHTH) protein